jgi:ATP-dependent Clp protease ATP-binding subunit ClpA
MFERFTDRARRVLVLAQEEAKGLGHAYIGTEHVLLGLQAEGKGVAARALTELGVDLGDLRRRILEVTPPTPGGTGPEAAPFTPRSKMVLEYSLREALALGHNYIGTEHLLLALIKEGEGLGAQILSAAGVGLDEARAKVIELLRGYVGGGSSRPAATGYTPAGAVLADRARAEAGAERLGTQHFLLAILADGQSLGARLLQSFGVTEEAVRDRVASMGVVGTSDELPPPVAARPGFEVSLGQGLTLRVDDDAVADQLKQVMAGNMREALIDILLRQKDDDQGQEGDGSSES